MHETQHDLERMQAVMDESYHRAGDHLLQVHELERRLSALQVAQRMQGMVLLTLATASSDGRPFTGPVDGFLVKGALYFGSSPHSLRFRHLRSRPYVSATHLPGEHFALTVHGKAVEIDLDDDKDARVAALRQVCIEQYGESWLEWGAGSAYARIEAQRMFAFHLDEPGAAEDDAPGTGVEATASA